MNNIFLFAKKKTNKQTYKKKMQSYINIKSIHLTLSQLVNKNVTMVVGDTNRLTPYHVIHGWFPVMPFHYIAFCPLRYIPKK
jgi:hypothetical protein